MARARFGIAAMASIASLALGCATGGASGTTANTDAVAVHSGGSLAQVYFWRAKPGKLDDYNRYIREVAEPIDEEARRSGAFISVATYMASDTSVAWTHMRMFTLRDSTQLRGLSAALSAAGVRLQPDSVKRRLQGEYSATLRDRVGSVVVELVR